MFHRKAEKSHNWRGFRGIAPPGLPTTSGISRRLRGVGNSNYESAWTWDIFLLSMLDEMVSAS
jgi:hypothetical protein